MKNPLPEKHDLFGQFSIEEATNMLNLQVVRDEDLYPNATPEKIGFVAGLLVLNDEPELVVKFMDGIYQFNKQEFERQLSVLTD